MAVRSISPNSKILTVALVLCGLDFQVISAFCQCSDHMICHKCQCQIDCGSENRTLGDCILRQEDGCVKAPSEDCGRLGGDRCRPQRQRPQHCNYKYCLAKLHQIFSCQTIDSCNAQQDSDELSDEKKFPTEIVVPILVCITVVILVAISTVILALYWKFKIKVIRETRRVNTYDVSPVSANQKSHEDPLYSAIDTSGYTEPPKLPPSRVPYYQEIESDRATEVAKTSPYYEIPLASLPQSCSKEGKKETTNSELMEPYQEPIDALRRADPSLKQENASNDSEKDEKQDKTKNKM